MADEPPVSAYEGHRKQGRRMADMAVRLPVGAIRDGLVAGAAGCLRWEDGRADPAEVEYVVRGPAGELPTVYFSYRLADGRVGKTRVQLTDTPTRHGGRRAWFRCPHVGKNGPCGRRVGTLYLPPGERAFACRTCHDLTYYSSRRAHQVERLFARWAGDDVPPLMATFLDLLGRETGPGRKRKRKRKRRAATARKREREGNGGAS